VTLILITVSSLVWGIGIGYGVPAFIDWTKREAAKLENADV
jgi:hypothetical protein